MWQHSSSGARMGNTQSLAINVLLDEGKATKGKAHDFRTLLSAPRRPHGTAAAASDPRAPLRQRPRAPRPLRQRPPGARGSAHLCGPASRDSSSPASSCLAPGSAAGAGPCPPRSRPPAAARSTARAHKRPAGAAGGEAAAAAAGAAAGGCPGPRRRA